MTNKIPKLKRKLTPAILQKRLKLLFAQSKSNKYNAAQIIKKLNISNSKTSVRQVLENLEKKGDIVYTEKGKFKYNNHHKHKEKEEIKVFKGVVDQTRNGDAFVVCDGLKKDIFVKAKNLKSAYHKDTVIVKLIKNENRKGRKEGIVIEIVSRAITSIIGKLHKKNKLSIVVPYHNKSIKEIYVKNNHVQNAEDGDVVLLEMTSWISNTSKTIWGKVKRILHDFTKNDLAMNSILLNNGFELNFPQRALEEVHNLNREISSGEIDTRRDFRNITTFTIDPETAKDFDDALSIFELDNGNLEVGIHIADVTHFVRQGSELDKEAFNRSTSVYLVDRVLPMLPEKLSNDLCSLNPNEDKYTFSAVFTFSSDYTIIEEWFGKTLIHSNKRFTYQEAQNVIESQNGPFNHELQKLNEIAKKLRKQRFNNGALSFESDEVQFLLDNSGKPINTFVKQRKEAHLLVEDFMLLANKKVASYIAKKSAVEIPYIYRIHDEPNQEKLSDLALFAHAMGIEMKIDTPKQIAESFDELHKKAQVDEKYKILQPIAIRTMSKAEYSTNNIGHYGLAFEYYTHFTSPIRRYSDVLVHRYLYKNLGGTYREDKHKLEAIAKHISLQERKAIDAERDSIKYKQAEYMLDKIGQKFSGRISGITDRGVYVELDESKIEGMIRFDKFDEPYNIADNRLSAIGQISNNKLTLGSPISVEIQNVDLDNKKIDMDVVPKYSN